MNDDAQIILGDNLEVMRGMPADFVDLVITSPPYEDARTYGIDFNLKGDAWVQWCADRFMENLRICKGLVARVVGHGKGGCRRWSAGPALLIAELHRRGACLRNPPIFARVGIPGSGQNDWLRADYEWIVCATRTGKKLPWSDNTACGHAPKWGPGGEMSYRLTDGTKRNQWGGAPGSGRARRANGVRQAGGRPSHEIATVGSAFGNPPSSCGRRPDGSRKPAYFKLGSRGHDADGNPITLPMTAPPKVANPGNIIKCIVGGGVMGSPLAHENEAPFPEKLVEFFVLSFCPPGGTVLDCHGGSGTTLAVAIKNGRKAIVIDVRESQVDIMRRREAEARAEKGLFA